MTQTTAAGECNVPEQGSSPTLMNAVEDYVSGHRNGTERRQALARFLRWFGDDRLLTSLTPADLEAYSLDASAETMGGSDRIKAVRDFLQHARKTGIVDDNLSQHVKLRRPTRQSRAKSARPGAQEPEVVHLTAEGHAELLELVEHLKGEMAKNAKEIQRAAADKDVRENAPLEAAREYQGQLQARLLLTEDTLTKARVVDKDAGDAREVRHGSTFRLEDVASGAVLEWTIVDPREADLMARKISTSSPVGEAVLGKRIGDEVEVAAPKGVMRYKLVHVE